MGPMAWLVYTNQRLGYDDEFTDLLLMIETRPPSREQRHQSSIFGCPILAAWAIVPPVMRLW